MSWLLWDPNPRLNKILNRKLWLPYFAQHMTTRGLSSLTRGNIGLYCKLVRLRGNQGFKKTSTTYIHGQTRHNRWTKGTHYLQVVLSVHSEPVAEHVPHDYHIALFIVHAEPIHTQELGQKGAPMTLHDVLEQEDRGCKE